MTELVQRGMGVDPDVFNPYYLNLRSHDESSQGKGFAIKNEIMSMQEKVSQINGILLKKHMKNSSSMKKLTLVEARSFH